MVVSIAVFEFEPIGALGILLSTIVIFWLLVASIGYLLHKLA
ncbi:MAG: hypothetical protein AB1861_09000 [Cyanobacteriota bacterium]